MDTGRTRRFKEKMELHIIILRKRRGFKAFALTGRKGITNIKPRANALGYELLPFQGVRRTTNEFILSGRKARTTNEFILSGRKADRKRIYPFRA